MRPASFKKFCARHGLVLTPGQSSRRCASTASTGTTVSLAPEARSPSNVYESASTTDKYPSLSLFRGNDGKGIDPAPLKSASLGIVALPTKSGETMSLRITLSFEDGKVLDQTFSSIVPAREGGGCVDAGASH